MLFEKPEESVGRPLQNRQNHRPGEEDKQKSHPGIDNGGNPGFHRGPGNEPEIGNQDRTPDHERHPAEDREFHLSGKRFGGLHPSESDPVNAAVDNEKGTEKKKIFAHDDAFCVTPFHSILWHGRPLRPSVLTGWEKISEISTFGKFEV